MQGSTRKLLQQINYWAKKQDTKMSTWKSETFLYTKDKHIEKEPRETSFHTDSFSCQRDKRSGNKPTQGTKIPLQWKRQDTEKKKTEKDNGRQKYHPCSWIRRINTVNIVILLKAIYKFYGSQSKFWGHSLPTQKEKNLEIHIETQKTKASQSHSEKREFCGRLWPYLISTYTTELL